MICHPGGLLGMGDEPVQGGPLSALQPNHGAGCLSRLQRSSGPATLKYAGLSPQLFGAEVT